MHPKILSNQVLLRALIVLSIFVYGCATDAAENKKTPEWYEIEASVDKDVQSKGLTTLLRTKYDGTDTGLLMREFNLRVRAGDFKEVARVIKKLASVPVQPDDRALAEMSNFLIGRREMGLSKLFLETFPMSSPGWGYVFLEKWYQDAPSKKTETEIDAWLGKRIATGKNSLYWKQERVRFLDKIGSAESFLNELAQEIKKNPAPISEVLDFIGVAEISSKQKPDLTWLPGAVQSASAYDNYLIGEKLGYRHSTIAAVFLERSLAAKYSADDQKRIYDYIRSHSALFRPPDESYEASLRSWTKQRLAEAYQQSGQPAKSQKLLVELSNERSGGLPMFAMSQMAGEVQSQLSDRPLEKIIKAAEPENTDSPEYWLGRAKYYTGRNENQQAVEAFDKALVLAPLSNDSSAQFMRRRVVGDYAYFFKRNNQIDKAAQLLWKEYDSTKDLRFQGTILGIVEDIDARLIKSDDNRLWTYLSRKPQWERSEELLIWKMFASEKLDKETFWRRAEQFAVSGDPSRAAVLGWVMTRTGHSARSIPLLTRACSMIKDKEKLEPTEFTLFEAYLGANRWKEAEQIWPKANKRLTPEEVPNWFSKIVLAAARSGATQDAFRLWKQKDELDRTLIYPLTELSKLGLKAQLSDYYRKMSTEDPSSQIPREALKLLGV